MPELPGKASAYVRACGVVTVGSLEVERAATLLREISQGNKIVDVEAVEDAIVYAETTYTEFVSFNTQWSGSLRLCMS